MNRTATPLDAGMKMLTPHTAHPATLAGEWVESMIVHTASRERLQENIDTLVGLYGAENVTVVTTGDRHDLYRRRRAPYPWQARFAMLQGDQLQASCNGCDWHGDFHHGDPAGTRRLAAREFQAHDC